MKLNKFKIASVFPGTTGFQYSDGENCSSVWPGEVCMCGQLRCVSSLLVTQKATKFPVC